jgi:hypothetical protein
MQFKDIKDDGTLYHVDVPYMSGRVCRVIDMGRMWNETSYRMSETTLVPAPERVTKPGNRDRGGWSGRSSTYGILVAVAERNAVDALTALDTTPVRTASRETAAQTLQAWRENFPSGIRVTVATSREIRSTWDEYNTKREQRRAEERAEMEQYERDRNQAINAEARVMGLLKSYGVCQVYGTPPVHKKYVTLDADRLSALLEKLDPQWVADAIADHLEGDDFGGSVPRDVIAEIRGCTDIVRRQIAEEIESSHRK